MRPLDATAVADAYARLHTLYLAAPEATRQAGRAWYPQAAREVLAAATRGGRPALPRAHALAMAAILSPRITWAQCLRAVETKCAGGPRRTLGVPWAAADALLDPGIDPATIVRGPKVVPFWHALMGDAGAAVVDVHMLRAAGLVPERSARMLPVVAQAIRDGARDAGESVRAYQATVWLMQRGG